jgi:hypothetical protein
MIGRTALVIVTLLLLVPSVVAGEPVATGGHTSSHAASVAEQAENGIVVTALGVEIGFPLEAVFTISVESSSEIIDVRLRYRVDKMNYADVITEGRAEFAPAERVEARWVWDMRQASLPPGAEVTYWWTIEDNEGNRLETSPEVMSFHDDRYSWRSMTIGELPAGTQAPEAVSATLFWYEGDDAFARELMDACEGGLLRLIEDIGAYPNRPIEIYIYASTDDLQGAMIFPQEWTGGVAYTEFSTIAIGIPPARLDWGKSALVHELTHLVVHQVTYGPYGQLPTWLDEGLAMYNEGELGSSFRTHLEQAIADGELISVRSLCSPFSAYPDQAYLSYAQSYSLVAYLLDEFGQEKMLDLLAVLKQGSDYDDALTEVYGFDIDGLDAIWRATLVDVAAPGQRTWLSRVMPALLGALAIVFVISVVVALRRRSGRRSQA